MNNDGLHVPKLTDSREDNADWVELYALKDSDGNASFSDLKSALSQSGTADALEDEEDDGLSEPMTDDDRCEAVAEGAFFEIADREESCKNSVHGYPFGVDKNVVLQHDDTLGSVYTFLLLLSRYGHLGGDKDGAKLFEEVCAATAKSYLGAGDGYADSYVFGFPRRIGPRGFCAATDELCLKLGEGIGHRERPDSPDQKDAKLDIVAWRNFADRRGGKLITFGQCATGNNWAEKVGELPNPIDWCTLWLKDRPAVWPIRAFFIPHRAKQHNWLHVCAVGGILFDRCRIVQHSGLVAEELHKRIAKWSNKAVQKHLK